MTIRTLKHVVVLSAAVVAAGCSNIGSVNGVRMNASTAPDATYCDKNPAICVIGAAAVAGGAIALVTSRDHSKPASAPPPPPPM